MAGPAPDQLGDLTEEEMGFLGRLRAYKAQESGYSTQQSTRPQTLGYGLADSPSGQAGWVLEKFWAWTDNNGHPEDAVPDGVYTDIRHWNQLDRGGHFAAFEEPDLFVDEVWASFRHVR